MYTAGGRTRAREAVQRTLLETGRDSLDDLFEVGWTERFIAGHEWPEDVQAQRLEEALRWPYGTLALIATRPPVTALAGSEHALINLVHQLDETERRALIELLKVTLLHIERGGGGDSTRLSGMLRLVEPPSA